MRMVFSVALLAVVTLMTPSKSSPQERPKLAAGKPAVGCELLEQALADVGKLKSGTRADVAKLFEIDEGEQTAIHTRYMYAKCRLLKVDIDFDTVHKESDSWGDPKDKVTKLSKLYVEWPTQQ